MSQGLRIVFAGTPEFAAAHLTALLGSHHQVVAVYSQPDRPAGRGKKLAASPVKQVALAHDIPVYQPLNFKSDEAVAELAALHADIMVVVAYGLILPQVVLESPRLGCINVHASLLPRWRGAAPIQRAIEAGDAETGVCIMQMDVGLDTGDVIIESRCPILDDDTASLLHDRLIEIGTPALLTALNAIANGSAVRTPQPEAGTTYASKLLKDEAALRWTEPADVLARRVRAFNPFPMAYTKRQGDADDQRIRVLMASSTAESTSAAPGTITQLTSKTMSVACGQGQLMITQVQLPGKKPVSVNELLRGHPDLFRLGDLLEMPQ